MEFPTSVKTSRLHAKLSDDRGLYEIVRNLRERVEALAAQTTRTVPNFTDHTIRHMDALWSVCDQIMTSEEIDGLTPAEAFLLSASFYLHDIGMAYAATENGAKRLRSTSEYKRAKLLCNGVEAAAADALSLATAARSLHANAAIELTIGPVPGTTEFLVDAKTARDEWGDTLGKIAASHHWSISDLESTYGNSELFPLPGNRNADLLFVACCLRLIDYAHINRQRARTIEMAFRLPLADGSLVHWLAQENIDGPVRTSDELVYRSGKAIADVDSWWLFYELLGGLNAEIKAVRRLLQYRKYQGKSISLVGVRGVDTPDEAARLIPPDGFLPVEVGVSTNRADKIVELLAGETLYGAQPVAAIRELLQNARDAVCLKKAIAKNEADTTIAKLPIRLIIRTSGELSELVVSDWGVGMSPKVMTDYLLSVGASYWDTMYLVDYPDMIGKKFQHAGRFGIGFLSVFMLGNEVTVESCRPGHDRYHLRIRGASQRGELRKLPGNGTSGTTITIKLKDGIKEALGSLRAIVESYAPTMPHDIQIEENGESITLREGWIRELVDEQFYEWMCQNLSRKWGRASMSPVLQRDFQQLYLYVRDFSHEDEQLDWPLETPTYRSGQTRLVASSHGHALLCTRGLRVQRVETPGFIGIIEIDDLELTSNRNTALRPDIGAVLESARQQVRETVRKNLEHFAGNDIIIGKAPILEKCVRYYGHEVITESRVPWIGQIKKPGNFQMITTAQFLAEISNPRSVFLAINIGPISAIKTWAASSPSDDEAAFVFPEISTSFYHAGGEIRSDVRWNELFPERRFNSLANLFFELLAKSWAVSKNILLDSSSFTTESSGAWGKFSKNH